jgi:hypothetical protein
MLMRVNRIWSEAWLLPGREIAVPDLDFCDWDEGACPREAVNMPAKRLPCVRGAVAEGD